MGTVTHSSAAAYGRWSTATFTILLSLACIGVDLALVSAGPAGENDLAVWGFLLVPLGGLPAFRAGLVGLTTRPTLRLALPQLIAGTVALGLPGILSAYAMREHATQWVYSIPWLFAPLVGWALLASGLVMIRDAIHRGKVMVITGGLLLSLPWLFGLWVVFYVTS